MTTPLRKVEVSYYDNTLRKVEVSYCVNAVEKCVGVIL